MWVEFLLKVLRGAMGQQVVKANTYLSVEHASKFGFVMDLKEICQLIIKLFGQEDIKENILQKKKSNLIVSESF